MSGPLLYSIDNNSQRMTNKIKHATSDAYVVDASTRGL